MSIDGKLLSICKPNFILYSNKNIQVLSIYIENNLSKKFKILKFVFIVLCIITYYVCIITIMNYSQLFHYAIAPVTNTLITHLTSNFL